MTGFTAARLFSAAFWRSLPARLAARRALRDAPIRDAAGLAAFIESRAAHVAQTALYGYLRTRAGTRFPELFSDAAFVGSINIAKWQVWLACVADLAVHAGCVLQSSTPAGPGKVRDLMRRIVDDVLERAGVPGDAGPEFTAGAVRTRSRIALSDFARGPEEAFSESPAALVHWAPVVDDLKALDEEIVRNSIRFRWHEVIRELERLLDAHALLAQPADVAAQDGGGRAEA